MLLPEYGTGDSNPANRLVKRKVVVFDRTINPEPIHYYSLHQIFQPPQEIQAWTAAAILAIKYENGQLLFKQQDAAPTYALDPTKRKLEQDILRDLIK